MIRYKPQANCQRPHKLGGQFARRDTVGKERISVYSALLIAKSVSVILVGHLPAAWQTLWDVGHGVAESDQRH